MQVLSHPGIVPETPDGESAPDGGESGEMLITLLSETDWIHEV